jgi:UDP-2,4-diacetamido-2,4,6-trideoxy-beta-L-altropyranose hydrolase
MAAGTRGTQGPLAVFRFDASPRLGGGHASRCLVLADALARAGWRCGLAFAAGSVGVVPELARRECLQLDGGADGEQAALAARWPEGCDLLVVDHYRRDAGFEDGCRPWARRIMVIDDLADRSHACDILLDQTLGRVAGDYEGLVPAQCRLLLGSRYALLRPEFAAAREAAIGRRRSPGPAARILVALGGSDPDNVTATVIDGIAAAGIEAGVDVVMGAGAPHLATVKAQVAGIAGKVALHVGVGDMAAMMTAADMAVGAAGTSAWERCCLGLPTLLVVLADNQETVAAHLSDAGAALVLGRTGGVAVDGVATAVADLCRSAETRRTMAEAAASVCDGYGVQRVVAGLLPPVPGRDGKPVGLRLATAADSALMLDWQRNDRTRRHGRNPCPPAADEHERWMRRYLGDVGGVLTVILHDGEPAGVLRFDATAGGLEVSILVAPERYRKGIGRAVLSLPRKLFPDVDLFAEVLPANAASQALFRGAGYRPLGDGP